MSSFLLNRTRNRIGALDPTGNSSGAGLCNHCVEYSQTSSVEVEQSWSYTYYPFDRHTIELNFSVADTVLYGCEQLAAQLRAEAGDGLSNLLPSSGAWKASGGDPISYVVQHDACEIAIEIRRNHLVFFVKQILVLVIIVEAGMLALRLNPLAPPLSGARISIQISSMLTIAVRSQLDLTPIIGKVTEREHSIGIRTSGLQRKHAALTNRAGALCAF